MEGSEGDGGEWDEALQRCLLAHQHLRVQHVRVVVLLSTRILLVTNGTRLRGEKVFGYLVKHED